MASSLVHSQFFLISQMDLCRVLLLLTMWHVSLSHGDCHVPSFRFKQSKGCVCILPCKIQMTMENAYATILSLLNSMVFYSILKYRLKLGNACYYSVQNLLSTRLLSKNLKIKIHRTIILPVVLYGCETWSLTLWEERKMRVFEESIWA